MNSDVPLDRAFFQLSPKRTRCELFVSSDGKTEKLASGFLKPFLTHLKVAEEQASHDARLINLEVGRKKNAAMWFSKGTVERFVRFVSTPEILELVNTFDAEMSQLEGARMMYYQAARDQFSDESEAKSPASVDVTKKELLRAIDVRLTAVNQDLATAYARACSAGFSLESVSELLFFADQFGAIRLSEACKNFLSLRQRRPDLISHQKSLPSAIHQQWNSFNDSNIRSSGSDMSIDEPEVGQLNDARSAIFHRGDLLLHSASSQPTKAVCQPTAAIMEHPKPDSRPLVEREMEKTDDPASSDVSSAKFAQQTGGSKRLTVQDRINLFESKQKEQLVSSNAGVSSSGATTISRLPVTKGEHRRNPSDVSVEKLVLRRWSGSSDMSIDLNCSSTGSIDRKESGSASGTPTSSANSQPQICSSNLENDGSGLIKASKPYAQLSSKNGLEKKISTLSSSQDQDRNFLKCETQTRDVVHKEGIASTLKEPPEFSKEKEQPKHWIHMGCSLESLEHGGMRDQDALQSRTKSFSNSREAAISKDPEPSQDESRFALMNLDNDQMLPQIFSRAPLSSRVPTVSKNHANLFVQSRDQVEVADIDLKTQSISVPQFRVFTSKHVNSGPKSVSAMDCQVHFEPSVGKMEDISLKGDSGHPESNISHFYEHETKQSTLVAPQGKTDEAVPAEGSSNGQCRKINEGLEAPPFSVAESLTGRPNTDNHALNEVLQVKAEELEKLFAEHKLKKRRDQVASSLRRKNLHDHAAKSVEKKPTESSSKQMSGKSLLWQDSSNNIEFDSELSGMIEKVDLCGEIKVQTFRDHSPTDGPRGKLYAKYMQIRDAKLSQECRSMRAQKEAQMKAMHDSLEHSQTEMKARFTGFSDEQKLADAHRRAEKLRSFNAHSNFKVREQTSEFLTGDGDGDDQELSESSIGNQSKKVLSYKPLSSTSLTSVSPSSKHLMKSPHSNSSKQKGQTENPVAQSVPTFLNLKNENIKPSAVATKVTPRGRPRSFARSKSSVEDTEILKEDRPRSNAARKNVAISAELKDLSSLTSEKTPINVQISGEFKRYLKKGNGVNHSSGAVTGKSKSSSIPEELKNREKFEEIVSQNDDSLDADLKIEEFKRDHAERNNLIMDLPVDSDSEKSRRNHESDQPESDNGDLKTPSSHLVDSTIIFSKFNAARNAEDSAEESSGSLNSHVFHSLVDTREASDLYASVDFPSGSPSWTSQPLGQIMDSEAARMRKKWGSSQIPVMTNSASQQSRRDVKKGFKRLLKFGRKIRGADYLLNDWVSASTASEGDDDLEDVRDSVHRPSDDFRKSRMGYCIKSYDGFNDSDIFPEQAQSQRSSIPNPSANFRLRDDSLSESSLKAPRSFFSLSSFRSKGGDSKPR